MGAFSGAGQAAQLVNCLPHKYLDLNLISRIYIKALGMVAPAYNPSTGEEAGESLWIVSQPASLAYPVNSLAKRKNLPIIKQSG